MAYEIISQNNTVTTLADENGNVIRVPSRAVLAVGETFTLTKVNNNVATLEDSSGKIYRDVPCVAVLYGGTGGAGDTHNKGYYATQAALEEAYPTGEAGDYAIVGATDTVWIWDEDTSAWVDSDQKGQVISVNSKTGTVVLTAEDVGALPQYSTMPVASSSNSGLVVQYTGATNANYTTNYIYKNIATTTPSSATASQTTGSSLSNIQINKTTFESEEQPTGDETVTFNYKQGEPTVTQTWSSWNSTGEPDQITISGNILPFLIAKGWSEADIMAAASELEDIIVYIYQLYGVIMVDTDPDLSSQFPPIETSYAELGQYLTISGTFISDRGLDGWGDAIAASQQIGWHKNNTTLVNISDYGITYTGTPVVDDAITVVYTAASTSYAWTRVDVQPTPVIPDPLPSQTGQSGKFLTTDGTDASWSDKPLVNTATGTSALTIAGTGSSYNQSVNVGYNSQTKTGGVAIGYGASVGSDGSVAIGQVASSSGGVSVGYGTQSTKTGSIAIGYNVTSTGNSAIQLGSYTNNPYIQTTNSEANTFKVGLGMGTNYKLLDSDGTIPADRLVNAINKYSTMPTAASTNEGWIVQYTGATDSTYTHGYIYECVSDGGNPATYSWTAVQVQAGGGGGGSYTAGTGIDITGTTISTDIPMATVSTSTSVPSAAAASGNTGTIAIGAGATAGGSYSGNNSIAIGENANAKDNFNGNYNVALGGSATAKSSATAIGYSAFGANNSVAIGANMCTYNGGVLIGCAQSQVTGTGKGCFDVVLYNDQTSTSTLYNILDINGILAADRLASTTGLADGNYRLRLTMASGVPTLSWVAE